MSLSPSRSHPHPHPRFSSMGERFASVAVERLPAACDPVSRDSVLVSLPAQLAVCLLRLKNAEAALAKCGDCTHTFLTVALCNLVHCTGVQLPKLEHAHCIVQLYTHHLHALVRYSIHLFTLERADQDRSPFVSHNVALFARFALDPAPFFRYCRNLSCLLQKTPHF